MKELEINLTSYDNLFHYLPRIYTEIKIEAPIEKVWNILVDFDEYDQWNSYTFNLSLPTKNPTQFIDNTFNLDVQLTEKKLIKQRELILYEISPDRHTIKWGGQQLGINTVRVQSLTKLDENSTKFENLEDFNGFLGWLPVLLYGNGMEKGMQRVCQELKNEAETQ